MKIMFTARATATGGRSGTTSLDDGSMSLNTAMPGSGQPGVNPEQLFAMGYAACFDNAVIMLARQQKKALQGSQTSVQVGLGQAEAGGYGLDIDLYVEVRGLPEAEAQALVAAAHQICPYSNAVRGNVDVRLHVTVA